MKNTYTKEEQINKNTIKYVKDTSLEKIDIKKPNKNEEDHDKNESELINNKFLKYININGLRNPKAIQYKDNVILIGSKVYMEQENKKKYLLYSYLLNDELNVIENTENILNFENILPEYKRNIDISCWIRDIYQENEDYYLLVEFKQNNNNEYFTSTHYYLKTKDFHNFEIHKKYDISDFFFKELDNHLFTSKIEKTDHIWGKYLFELIINNQKIRPFFDKIVDYKIDYGHVFHNIEKKENTYYIIFSIRYYDENEENNFYYKIFQAQSNDLIHFTNTKPIEIDLTNINSKWLCYPWKFQFNDKDYIICNQDDYGKEKEPVIFKFSKI